MAGPVGALRVTLGANTAQFEQGMRRAAQTARRTGQDIERSYVRMSERGVRAFSTLRTGVAGFAAAMAGNVLVNYARDSLQWAAGLSETAQQIGVTVEQLQALRLAAEQNGASVEGMERAMGILNRTLGQAQGGSRAAIQAFRSIGITQEQLRSFRTGGEALQAVITALTNLRNPAQQAAAAQALFGRGARELMVMLTQGAGAMQRWTDEARRAGIITDEQARKADEAEDALSRLATTIRASLAGAMADALPGILAIIDSLGRLANLAIRVIGLLGQVTAGGSALISGGTGGSMASAGMREHARREFERRFRELGAPRRGTAEFRRAYQDPELRRLAPGYRWAMGIRGNEAAPATTGDVDFNAGGGGGGGGSRRRDNNEAERRAQQVEQEARRLQIEELQARVQMVDDLDERNELNSQIADLERQQWLSEKSFALSQGELSQAQFDRLAALQQINLTTQESARILEHTRAGQEREAEIAAEQAQAQEETLRAHIGLARTAEERRRLELELLEITYRNRRTALQMTIQNRPGSREAEVAQSALADLPGRQRAETRTALRSTMGPLEAYMFELPRTAEQVREALQSVAVDGLQSISDGLIDVITGARKMGDVFRSVVTSIISDLIRIQLQKAIIGPLANMLGGIMGGAGGGAIGSNSGIQGLLTGLPGRASGGPVLPGRMYVVGEKGPELLRMGGQGGHVIANDNIGGGGDVIVHQSFKFDGVAVTKDEFIRGLLATKDATMVAVREAQRRRA